MRQKVSFGVSANPGERKTGGWSSLFGIAWRLDAWGIPGARQRPHTFQYIAPTSRDLSRPVLVIVGDLRVVSDLCMTEGGRNTKQVYP